MTSSKQFFSVKPVIDTLKNLFQHIFPIEDGEIIPVVDALGRVLSNAPTAAIDLPEFRRSAMDGFAVRAEDTFGAMESLPAYLKIVGHIQMGEVPTIAIEAGQAAEIHTGAMLPEGADAVVMVEQTQRLESDEVEILGAVAPGEHVIQIGEDVRKGSEILPAGHRLRAPDIGGLLAVGIQDVRVARRLRVGILSSGDELIDVDEEPDLGQIRDINSYMLSALCSELGADVLRLGIARDSFESLHNLAADGLAKCDMLVMSAGSSVSVRDLTFEVARSLGEPGIIQHGLAVKPGKPTIIAACDGKPVIGLPGNPVSALLVARQVLLPVLRYLSGEKERPVTTLTAKLSQNVASATGREDTIPVRLIKTEEGYLAEPVFGKSNLIYTLLRADGLFSIPLNTSGYLAGAMVEVII